MRLIDADMADVVIVYDRSNELTQVSAIREYIERQKTFLDKFPTIDAVPVVRCDSCVLEGNCFAESHFRFAGIENPFCCVGKRKGNVMTDAVR